LNLLDTSVVDIAFVYDAACDQDVVDLEELLYPVIIFDAGSQNGGFNVGIICWSFGGMACEYKNLEEGGTRECRDISHST
jgi:hypothetical protein